MQVAFQGVTGAYSEQAVIGYFGAGVSPEPTETVAAVFDRVMKGEVDAGLVALRNSLAGPVIDTFDQLRATSLFITGEIIQPINHCLLCLPGQNLGQITRVFSHPQALAQCANYLRRQGFEPVPFYDTAGSAEHIRQHRLFGVAAIASARAAALYQLDTLASGIQNDPSANYTHFVVLRREPHQPPDSGAKTILRVGSLHTPDDLFVVLRAFAERHIPMLKGEARPALDCPWHYVYFIEVATTPAEESVATVLEELAKCDLSVQVLGVFAASPHPDERAWMQLPPRRKVVAAPISR